MPFYRPLLMGTREKFPNVPAMKVIVAVPAKSTYPRRGHTFDFAARPEKGTVDVSRMIAVVRGRV